MTPRFLTACEAFQPAEKACWEILLHEQAGKRVAAPKELDRAMDAMLAQLWSLLRARNVEEWMRETPAPALPPWLPPGCGLAAVLEFFATGQRALDLIMGEIEKATPAHAEEQRVQRRIELGVAFNVLVQRELDALCGNCTRTGTCALSGRRIPPELAAPQPPAKRAPATKRHATHSRRSGE